MKRIAIATDGEKGFSGKAKVALNDYLSGKFKGFVECKHHEEKTCHKQRR